MINVPDIVITSLETINAFDITTGNYLFTIDELQSASLANGQEKADINGKQGRKLSSMKRNKTVTVSGENGMVSAGLLEMQTGGTFANKATDVMWTDYLTVGNSNDATTTYKAIGTVGSEIVECYIKNSNGTLGTELTQVTSSISSGKFTYTAGTKKLQFHTDVTAGTEVVVFYKRHITADVLANESDKYSKKCSLYIDALGEDRCANVYRVQFYIPKADFSGEFTFDMGDNQTIHSFEAEGLAGACGAGGALWTYTIFGANTADTAVSG